VLTWTVIDSPVDDLLLVATDGALRSVWFSPHKGKPQPSFIQTMTAEGGARDDEDPVLVDARRQLGEYFAGDRREFDLPLAPVGTDFQLRVWAGLRTIPYGQTWSYGELAAAIGKGPLASRAVGLANGANPLSIVVPCHRVIGANGNLTGFGGGIERKRWLLDLEQPSLLSGLAIEIDSQSM
jgi:methylated-DNA-[protein]-cysteine S-methyltransferase